MREAYRTYGAFQVFRMPNQQWSVEKIGSDGGCELHTSRDAAVNSARRYRDIEAAAPKLIKKLVPFRIPDPIRLEIAALFTAEHVAGHDFWSEAAFRDISVFAWEQMGRTMKLFEIKIEVSQVRLEVADFLNIAPWSR